MKSITIHGIDDPLAELIKSKAQSVKILNATAETAEVFGMVKQNLKKAVTPLPINDVWIAAHALETGSTLVTYDNHFKKIAGIRRWHQAQTITLNFAIHILIVIKIRKNLNENIVSFG